MGPAGGGGACQCWGLGSWAGSGWADTRVRGEGLGRGRAEGTAYLSQYQGWVLVEVNWPIRPPAAICVPWELLGF